MPRLDNVGLYWELVRQPHSDHVTLLNKFPDVFPSDEKPYYRKGMWISAAFCLLVAVLSVCLSTWLIYENRKLDKLEAEAQGTTEKPRRKLGQRVGEGGYRYVW